MENHSVECELAEAIEQAFARTRYPFQGDISIETYDDEGTEDFFRRTTWHEHVLEDSNILCSCLWFLTPRAFCYFLPAFLLASLRDRNYLIKCWGHIIAQIAPSVSHNDWRGTRAKMILNELSSDQKIVLLKFLEYAADGDSGDTEVLNAIKALEDSVSGS